MVQLFTLANPGVFAGTEDKKHLVSVNQKSEPDLLPGSPASFRRPSRGRRLRNSERLPRLDLRTEKCEHRPLRQTRRSFELAQARRHAAVRPTRCRGRKLRSPPPWPVCSAGPHPSQSRGIAPAIFSTGSCSPSESDRHCHWDTEGGIVAADGGDPSARWSRKESQNPKVPAVEPSHPFYSSAGEQRSPCGFSLQPAANQNSSPNQTGNQHNKNQQPAPMLQGMTEHADQATPILAGDERDGRISSGAT